MIFFRIKVNWLGDLGGWVYRERIICGAAIYMYSEVEPMDPTSVGLSASD